MKNFNKLFGGLILLFSLMSMGSLMSHAGSLPRSPKTVFVSSYTTGAIQVTPNISSNAVVNASFAPGAVYQVVLTTGASGEYELLVDTSNCTGITAAMVQSGLTAPAKFLTTRLIYSSTGTATDYKFDPPMFFENGLCVVDSAITGQAAITYELGRGISGN